jgi:ribose transport system permease protein
VDDTSVATVEAATEAKKLRVKQRQKAQTRINVFALVPYLILLALIIAVVSLNPRLLSLDVVEAKLNGALPLMFVTTAQALVILTGGIDLSIGGVLSLATAIAATQMNDAAGSIVLWSLIILLVGFAAGVINGLIVTYMRVTPFIATLATWSVWGGIALFVLPKEGGSSPRPLKQFVQKFGFLGLPKSLWILVLLIVAWLLLRRTRFITRVYAVGSNRNSAYLSGAPVKRTLIMTYALSGLLAAMGGLYRTINLAAGSPTAGDPYILTSAAAVIMGGMSLAGGRGGIIPSIVGAFILLFINDLNYFLGVSTFYTPMVQGVLLIVAVAVQSLGNYLRARRVAR